MYLFVHRSKCTYISSIIILLASVNPSVKRLQDISIIENICLRSILFSTSHIANIYQAKPLRSQILMNNRNAYSLAFSFLNWNTLFGPPMYEFYEFLFFRSKSLAQLTVDLAVIRTITIRSNERGVRTHKNQVYCEAIHLVPPELVKNKMNNCLTLRVACSKYFRINSTICRLRNAFSSSHFLFSPAFAANIVLYVYCGTAPICE